MALCHRATVCTSNTYSAVAGSTVCSACPANSNSAANAKTCACAAGFSTSGSGDSLVCSGRLLAPAAPFCRAQGLTDIVFARGGGCSLRAGIVQPRWHDVPGYVVAWLTRTPLRVYVGG